MVARCFLTYYVNILQLSSHPLGARELGLGLPGASCERLRLNLPGALKNNYSPIAMENLARNLNGKVS